MSRKKNIESQVAFHFGDENFSLPALYSKPRRVGCGVVQQQLLSPRNASVRSALEIAPAGRGELAAYLLDDGTSCLTTKKEKYSGELLWDGVLHVEQHSRWLAHRKLERFTEKWRQSPELLRTEARDSWKNGFRFRTEELFENGLREEGLRQPQIGALHAIGAHWTISTGPGTVVMPTGTGKTETMLSALIAYRPECLLVVVPSDALRKQIAGKFLSLGVLEREKCLEGGVQRPVVGIIRTRPRSESDLEIFRRCNVVIATAAVIAQGTSAALLPKIAALCSHLIFDEAHHVPASSWSLLKEHFANRHILQFTATPYRTDGALIEGRTIYSYPLKTALDEGYFKKIDFQSVYHADRTDADEAIADLAVKQLRKDLADGFNHRLMARCIDTKRADEVEQIYRRIAADLNPISIHSRVNDTEAKIEDLRRGDNKIVICVNMLAEGFDMPELKIAAAHDKHKSLAALLQFVGRISRVSGDRLGGATFIANTADQVRGDLIGRLYSEDADWEEVLGEVHATVTEREERMRELVHDTKPLHSPNAAYQSARLTLTTLFPRHSAFIRRATKFEPEKLLEAMQDRQTVVRNCWLNEKLQMMVAVTQAVMPVDWATKGAVREDLWTLYIVRYDPALSLIYFHASTGDIRPDWWAAASGGTASLVADEGIFRVFGNLNRLLLIQVGVKKKGGSIKHRYSMYTGTDVSDALSALDTRDAVRSNFFGHGFSDGKPHNFGASAKGKVWSHGGGRIDTFLDWCTNVGAKITNLAISPDTVFKQAIRPKKIDAIPDEQALHVTWPDEICSAQEESLGLRLDGSTLSPFSECEISLDSIAEDRKSAVFLIEADNWRARIKMEISKSYDAGHKFSMQDKGNLVLVRGQKAYPLDEYFDDYPPVMFFVSGTDMAGALIYPIEGYSQSFPNEQIRIIDWSGVNIQNESIWKDGVRRCDSVQWKSFDLSRGEGWEVIMDDDGSNEAADLVCVRRGPKRITVRLIHCKYSGGPVASDRIEDAVVVASQATRCVRWNWNFEKLCQHLIKRNERRMKRSGQTRFLVGDIKQLKQLAALGRLLPVEYEIVAAQPGISQKKLSQQQRMVLGSADHFIRQTTAVGLTLWCSK